MLCIVRERLVCASWQDWLYRSEQDSRCLVDRIAPQRGRCRPGQSWHFSKTGPKGKACECHLLSESLVAWPSCRKHRTKRSLPQWMPRMCFANTSSYKYMYLTVCLPVSTRETSTDHASASTRHTLPHSLLTFHRAIEPCILCTSSWEWTDKYKVIVNVTVYCVTGIHCSAAW